MSYWVNYNVIHQDKEQWVKRSFGEERRIKSLVLDIRFEKIWYIEKKVSLGH